MKVSLNHIRYYQQKYQWSGDPAPNGLSDLLAKIGAQLGAVEEVIPVGERYDGVLVVRVISCEDHPNADRLHVCKIDDGGKAEGVERDENGHVQVVCGAPNVREGLTVAWLPPGSTVPSTYNDEDPFVLDSRPLRGVVSNGMLTSPKELGIGDSHEGILEIDDESIEPGTSFADAFNYRGDVVIDMENKMFTHRPDCFGMLGVARELAGIQAQQFKSPDWYSLGEHIEDTDGPLKVEVKNDIPELVPRFVVIPMNNITVKPSPVWLQTWLSRLGVRPINNIVDLTNYFMLLTGQPLHAYDYDKVVAQDAGADHATIVVRKPKPGEKILLLNGKEIEPRLEAIMIATNDKLIGVGGVMGGGDTEVDDNTKNIILECANFDMYSVRRTSMAHGLFTDAVTRFNKGQSPLQNIAVLSRTINDVKEIVGGQVAGRLVDDNHLPAEVVERGSVEAPVVTTRAFINSRLGLDLSSEEMAQLLRNVEFAVTIESDTLSVQAPFWRTDIAIPEDVVEEVGRLYGFDHLPQELPKRDLTPTPRDELLELKAEVRDLLADAGANEILSYSFVHGNLFDKVGQDKNLAFQISNALSPDLQYYRMSLTPSLLEKVHMNIKAGFDEFVLFEVNKTHHKVGLKAGELPTEYESLALVVAASDKKAQTLAGAAFYRARTYLDYLAKSFGLELDYLPLGEAQTDPVAAPFDYHRSAGVYLRGTDTLVGLIGEYRQSVLKALKLPVYCAGFEVSPEVLLDARTFAQNYKPLPRFPKVEQDICLRVRGDLPYQELARFVEGHLDTNRPDQTHHTLEPIDIYQPEDQTNYKQITFRLSIASYERTLTDDEVNRLLDAVAAAAHDQFGAERI
ncbi:MAG TPA: phenylalanine--tRNA ligase subunit beta [Candidatus Saccharimonadales bacterium]